MLEPTDKVEQLNRFKEFVHSYGYELDVSDSGISIGELLESFKSICGSRLDESCLTDEIAEEVSKDVGSKTY